MDRREKRKGSALSETQKDKPPYKGIRMRKWGKWVAEVREPNKRSRIWLGSYSSPIAAARAYDTAVFYLRGPCARMNFPQFLVDQDPKLHQLSSESIRKKATEIGARVEALEKSSSWKMSKKPDLNLEPTPDSSDED